MGSCNLKKNKKYDSKVEELRETRREAEQEKKAYKDRREKFDSVLEIHQKNSSVRGEYIIDRINMLSNIANKDVYKLSETEMKEIQEIYYDTANLKLHKEEIHGKRINYKALESAYDQVITRMELEGGKEQEIEWMEYLQRFGQEDGLVL